MERVWLYDAVAVTVARIDFLDPAMIDEPDARERGVRVEVRPVSARRAGSVYASSGTNLHAAVCRIDLLESRPGAADRMHWHPTMTDGEPGDRVFDAQLAADPLRWLGDRLRALDDVLRRAGLPDVDALGADVAAVRADSAEIVADADRGLAWARQPWPPVLRDERGLALSP